MLTNVSGVSEGLTRMMTKTTLEPCPTCGRPRPRLNGAWLRGKRERAGLSLREMARRMKLSAPYVSDIERNRRGCPDKVRQAYEALQ